MSTWENEARNVLRAELARSGATGFKTLTTKLAALGVEETEANLSNKIARGKFSFVFFLQCMKAIGVTEVRVGVSDALASPRKRRKPVDGHVPSD